jgi:hypothetical protein
MRPSFVTLAALAALSGKYVVDARALSNNLARIVSSVATHDLDTVLYEKQKREVILPNTPRAQPGVPAVPAPKVPTGPAPKPPAVPAPKPPSTPDKPGVPEPVAPELGRPEPGRPEPGRPEPGSPGGNPEGELPANEQVAPADLVQLEQGCAKAKRDAGLPLYGADLEHSQLRGRSPDDRSRKTPRDALQKRGSDEFARTKPEWQDSTAIFL